MHYGDYNICINKCMQTVRQKIDGRIRKKLSI